MITKDNLKFFFEDLTEEQTQEIDSDQDYLLCELHIFNAGATATVESKDFDSKTAKQAADSGQLFIDKDDFLRLYKESGANNKFINELI